MARYIIQDAYTGYIWGDTAVFIQSGQECPTDILTVCKRLDESLGAHGRTYQQVSQLDGDTGYLVYDACADGSEVIGNIMDGQDQEVIDEVIEKCRLVGYVQYEDSDKLGPYD